MSQLQKLMQREREQEQCNTDRIEPYQWSRTESTEIKPYVYSQLIFDKGSKTIQ